MTSPCAAISSSRPVAISSARGHNWAARRELLLQQAAKAGVVRRVYVERRVDAPRLIGDVPTAASSAVWLVSQP